MDLTTTLGLVAGSLTTVAYLPQVLKTWRSRSADGMSWSMLIILCVGIALWLIYGLYASDMPVVLANLVTLVLASAILVMKIRYEAVPKLRMRRQLLTAEGTPSLEAAFAQVAQEWQFDTAVTFSPPEQEPSSPVA